jgi:hypothetical protein
MNHLPDELYPYIFSNLRSFAWIEWLDAAVAELSILVQRMREYTNRVEYRPQRARALTSRAVMARAQRLWIESDGNLDLFGERVFDFLHQWWVNTGGHVRNWMDADGVLHVDERSAQISRDIRDGLVHIFSRNFA